VLAHVVIKESTERDSDRASYARGHIDRINAQTPPMSTPPRLPTAITPTDTSATGITVDGDGAQPAFHPTARPSAAPPPRA